MAVRVEWIGLDPDKDMGDPTTFFGAMKRMIDRGGNYVDVLDNLGRDSVTKSKQKILDNKVTPPTKQVTLDARRGGGEGITLADLGIGKDQIAYKSGDDFYEVGVPKGYMSAHQRGVVPTGGVKGAKPLPARKFLMLMNKRETLLTINHHWHKAIKGG